MKQLKQPTKQSLSIALMALGECFEGLSEDIILKAIRDYGSTKTPKILTTKEAAEKLRYSKKTICNLIKKGTLETVENNEIGRGGNIEFRILESSVIKFIYGKTDPAATESA